MVSFVDATSPESGVNPASPSRPESSASDERAGRLSARENFPPTDRAGSPLHQLKAQMRQRSLAGSRRAGVYSRGKALTLTKDFVRRTWWLLLVVPVVCVVPFIPLSVLSTGTARAVVITAALDVRNLARRSVRCDLDRLCFSVHGDGG